MKAPANLAEKLVTFTAWQDAANATLIRLSHDSCRDVRHDVTSAMEPSPQLRS
jgi:hypothetical protein